MSSELDVVIIGGGIHELPALEPLEAQGYDCALVTHGARGAGQTLHSHGFLNTGFGMLGTGCTEFRTTQQSASLVHAAQRC